MKRNIKELSAKLAQKEEKLGPQQRIITPESGISAAQQATWMIGLLEAVYVKHGITRNPLQVEADIASGRCRCWFVVEGDKALAVAAQIRQPDGSVELGRAVALTPGMGLGAIALLRATLDHWQNVGGALTSETRVAAQFAGIPSGEATQKITFIDLGLSPRGLVAMFGHGEPFRQEMFLLGTTEPIPPMKAMLLPTSGDAKAIVEAMVVPLLPTGSPLAIEEVNAQGEDLVELVQTEPFAKLAPKQGGKTVAQAQQVAFEVAKFILLPVECSMANTKLIQSALENDFVACGIDNNPGVNGHPVLLLGKLRAGTPLAPTKILAEAFNPGQVAAMQAIDSEFRRKGAK